MEFFCEWAARCRSCSWEVCRSIRKNPLAPNLSNPLYGTGASRCPEIKSSSINSAILFISYACSTTNFIRSASHISFWFAKASRPGCAEHVAAAASAWANFSDSNGRSPSVHSTIGGRSLPTSRKRMQPNCVHCSRSRRFCASSSRSLPRPSPTINSCP